MTKPKLWVPKSWRLEQEIANEEIRLNQATTRRKPWWYGTTQLGRTPEEGREPIGWPWEWVGAGIYGLTHPSEEKLTWGQRIEQYRQLPWWQTLGYEAPFWAATMLIPGAAAIRGSHSSRRGYGIAWQGCRQGY